ncbi:uncharacterized protein LOC142897500 isoform X2 [Nelusetta ayraudi]|uniref:uncharacterized protein LOC142897500 isoform X2 n=1 Tax=Nelusetta ayraudi TaxID=303726 RepID=UPI003F713BA4
MAQCCFSPLFLCLLGSVPVQPVIDGLKGQQVQLDPVVTGKPDEILWKHNGNKVVEFSGTEEQVFGSYRGRVILDRLTAGLQISDLRLEDSGEYELEVFTQGKWLQSSHQLEVGEKVAKPTVTCQEETSNLAKS